MIQGITIQLAIKSATGIDDFNRPIYDEEMIAVDNVLVGQPSTDDIITTVNLTGKKAVYWLGIPKGDTNDWEDAKVVLPAPFAGVYRTIGFPIAGIEAMIPLSWNKKIMVERYG